MNSDCLFCKIASHEIPADITFEDDQVVAFKDTNAQAPVHMLIIPRKHINTINDMGDEDHSLIGYMVSTAQKLAEENDISAPGYRLIMNCNQQGGQTVFHIHLHLLGGRQLMALG